PWTCRTATAERRCGTPGEIPGRSQRTEGMVDRRPFPESWHDGFPFDPAGGLIVSRLCSGEGADWNLLETPLKRSGLSFQNSRVGTLQASHAVCSAAPGEWSLRGRSLW